MSDLTLEVGQANELKMAFRRHGYTAEEVKKLGEGNFLAQVLLVLRGLADVVLKPILELVNAKIKVSARERFVVADNFRKGNAGIYYLGENFTKWFGDKVEENIPAAMLSSHRLSQNSVDGPIKTELGEGHEMFLTWLFEKIEVQADGREGELLVDGRANIFYIDGRVVDARWDAGFGWDVYAREVTYPLAWHAGCRVFSRNSVLKSLETLETAQA